MARLQKQKRNKKTGKVKSNQMTTNKNAIINHSREINTLYKIVDKLEQRISTLEKVLQSHAKCIGEMREKNFIPIRKDQIESIEKELNNNE